MRKRFTFKVLLGALLVSFTALPSIQADEPAIRPGQAIGLLTLGESMSDTGRVLGRSFGQQDVGACGKVARWSYQEGDSILSAGQDIVVWVPIISGQTGDRLDAVTIEGGQGTLTTAGGVGLGSSSQDVIAEFGPPTSTRPDGDNTYMVYDSRGIQFRSTGDAVRAVTVFWPLPTALDVRPFDGLGPVSLAMDEPSTATAMGRPADLVTPTGRDAWSLSTPPGLARGGCPYLAVGTESGKIRDVFTNAAGFRTHGGVQIGDNIDNLTKEVKGGRASTGPIGEVLWTTTTGKTPGKFIAGYHTAQDGVRRILFFWVQAY